MSINRRRVCLIKFGLVLCVLNAPAQAQVTEPKAAKEEEVLRRRIESASEIISDAHSWQSKAEALHKQAQRQIIAAKALKGEAEFLQTKTPVLPNVAPLSGAELEAAKGQYQIDVKDFIQHARDYNAHLEQFRQTVGECHANNVALEDVIRKYGIHLNEFHVPTVTFNVRPPHICGALRRVYGSETQHVANMIMNDQIRVLRAEANLRTAETNLQTAETAMPALQGKAVNVAVRDEREQDLMGEFSKLRQEYDLLKLEKEQLAGNRATVDRVVRKSVSAQTRKD